MFNGEHRVAFETFDEELTPGPGEVLIETLCSMVSAATELAKLTGLQRVEYSFVPGNRAVGRVLAVGQGVTRVQPGDTVCTHTPHVSHASTRGFCLPAPAGLRMEHLASVGLSLVAMTAVRMARPELGDRVVVFGLGVVGNLCAQLFALSGARVVGVDTRPGRLEVARRCGVQSTVDASNGDAEAAILALTGSEGAEFVVEATGNPEVVGAACRVARRQGELILLGSPRGEHSADLTPLLNHVHLWREHGSLTFKGAHEWRFPLYNDGFSKHSFERNAEVVFRLMAEGRLILDPLITHVVAAAGAPEVYAGLSESPADYLGVVLDWRTPKAK